MNLYLISLYCSVSFLLVASANLAESAILREEQNSFQHEAISAAQATDYTLYFDSRHFDLMNADDWNEYKTSTQPLDSKQAYDNSLEEALLQQQRAKLWTQNDDYQTARDEEDQDLDYYHHLKMDNNIQETLQQALFNGHRRLLSYYDELYYNYYITDDEGQKQILNEIHACSQQIEALDDRKLCVEWHHDDGLRLSITDNAYSQGTNVMEFNNDDHWNRVDIVDSINKAAARGYMESNIADDDYDDDYLGDADDYNEYYEEYYTDPILDSRRRALQDGDADVDGSDLAFVFGGLAQRKCQSFDRYTLCAKYNPSERRYRISLDMALGRNPKSAYQQNRQNIQQSAAKALTDNILSINGDAFTYDDDDALDYDADEEEAAVSNFEYGDVFALSQQDAAQIGWQSLQNYGGELEPLNEDMFAAKTMMHRMSDDYTYYFDDWKFNWNNDYDWDDFSDDNEEKDKDETDVALKRSPAKARTEKCTPVIPGLDHKVCLSLSEENIGLRFAAGSDAEIGDMMYDIYASYDAEDDDAFEEDYDSYYDGMEDEDYYYDDNDESEDEEDAYDGEYEDQERTQQDLNAWNSRRRALYDDEFEAVLRELDDDFNDEYQTQDEQFEAVLRDLDEEYAQESDAYQQLYDDLYGDEQEEMVQGLDDEYDEEFEAILRALDDEYEEESNEALYDGLYDEDALNEIYDNTNDEEVNDFYDEDGIYDDDDLYYEDALYDAELEALYDAYDEYDDYYDTYLNDVEDTIRTALTTEFNALGQLDFSNNDDWDKVQIINNAAKTTEDDRVYFADDYYYDEDEEEDHYFAGDLDDAYYDSVDDQQTGEDDYYSMAYRRRMQAPPPQPGAAAATPEAPPGTPPAAPAAPAAAGGAGGGAAGPRPKDAFKEGYEMGTLMEPQLDLRKRGNRKRASRRQSDELTKAIIYAELDGENRVLRALQKAEMESEAIGGGAIPGGGPPGFGYNGGKYSGVKTTGGRGLVIGRGRGRGGRRRRCRNGRRCNPRRRVRMPKYGHYPVLPAAPRPYYDNKDFTMPPPPPPLFSRRSRRRRRRKKPSITVKHYHYNMGRPRRRRRRRRGRVRKRGKGGLVNALLGPGLAGGTRRRRRRRKRRRPRRGKRKRKKRRHKRRRRRKKKHSRPRSFGAMVEGENMAYDDYESYDDDNAEYFDTISAFGTDSMYSTLSLMDMSAYSAEDTRQLRKCKAFAMTETCVTLDPHRGDIMLEVSVGSQKARDGFAANAREQEEDVLDYGMYDDEYYEFSANEDVEDVFNDEIEQNEWMVSDIAADEEYDEVWNDDSNWEQIDEIQTKSGNFVQRKCLHVWGQRLCLCQFLAFLDNRKFQCQPKGDRFYNPMGPGIPQREMMIPKAKPTHEWIKEEEIKPLQPIKPIKPKMSKTKLKAVVNKALKKAVKKEEKKETAAEKAKAGQKKKMKLLIPKHIPYKFQPLEIPKSKPKWLPHWMWQEFKTQNEHHKQEKKAQKAIKKTIKKQIIKRKAEEKKAIKEKVKVLKKVKAEAKKQIKKDLEKEIKKEKLKAAKKTEKKAVKITKKIIKKEVKTKKANDKLKKKLTAQKAAAMDQYFGDSLYDLDEEEDALDEEEDIFDSEYQNLLDEVYNAEILDEAYENALDELYYDESMASYDNDEELDRALDALYYEYFDDYYADEDEDAMDGEYYDDVTEDDDDDDALYDDDEIAKRIRIIKRKIGERKAKWVHRAAAMNEYFGDDYMDNEDITNDYDDAYDDAFDRVLDELDYDSIDDEDDTAAINEYFGGYYADDAYNGDIIEDDQILDEAFDRALDELYYDDETAAVNEYFGDDYDDEEYNDDILDDEYQNALDDDASYYESYDDSDEFADDYYKSIASVDDVDEAFNRALDELDYDNVDDQYDRALDQLYSDLGNYYEDQDDDYYYEDVSDTAQFGITERDHWHDATDDNDWIVSSLSTTDLDNVWQDPSQWDLVDKVKTESGRTIQRKCLHMWHHRLCLCQFLEWIDDAKYKCYPRGEQVPIMRAVPKPKPKPKPKQPKQATLPKPKAPAKKGKEVVSKFHQILTKLKAKHGHTVKQGTLLKKLEDDISKLESLEKKKEEHKPHPIESGLPHKALQSADTKKGAKGAKGAAASKYPVTKLIKQTIDRGAGVDAMRAPRNVVKNALLDNAKHSGGAGHSAYALAHDAHSPQLSRIEALLHHLISTHGQTGPHWDGGPHNVQLGRIESMLLHLAARQHAAQHGVSLQGGARPMPMMQPRGANGIPMIQPQGGMPMLPPQKQKESEEESSEEQSEAHGYDAPGQTRRRYRHSERLWRKRQRGIGPGQSRKKSHGIGRALGGLMKGINKETDVALNSPRQYFHGKHLPTFGDHPGHGDVSGHGFKGDIPNVPLHWHLAGVHAPNIGPQQHLIMSQPAHPDYPRKSYYMVITGYPKYGLPENRPNWIPSYMWSQMQALQHRGIDVANQLDDADNNLLYEDMTEDYDDYDYYTNNGLDDEEQTLETYYEDYEDEWLDVNDGEQWVIMEDAEGFDDEIVSEEEWNNDALWELMEKAVTSKGFKVEKKCMNVFGRPLCLCQFVEWVEHGTMKKQCAPKEKMKVVKPPKKKPKWMPHNFWGYLNNAKEPHKPPSHVNRKKWKLYLKFKNKGYAAQGAQFGDYLLYDDDEEMMDALLDDIEEDEEEHEMYDNALLDALIDGDYDDDDEAAAILDELLNDDDEEEEEEVVSATDALLDKLLNEKQYQYEDDYEDEAYDEYYDSAQEDDEIIDEWLREDEKHAAKEALVDKLLQSAYGEYDDDEAYYVDAEELDYYLEDEAKQTKVDDWWVDEDDSNEWVVTDQSTTDYDDKWLEDREWDHVSKRIRTKSGHLMTRKCLTIWKKRLCFCQFLNWIDGKKYKCMPRTEARADYDYASDIDIDDDQYYHSDADADADADAEDMIYENANQEYHDALYDSDAYHYDANAYDDDANGNADADDEVTDEYLEAILSGESGDYSDDIANYRNHYESSQGGTDDDKYYISGDGSEMNYMQELKEFMHRSSEEEVDHSNQYEMNDVGGYNSLNNEEKAEYDQKMSAMHSYMNQMASQFYKYADDDYGDALAQYQKQNEDFFSGYQADENYDDYNEEEEEEYEDEDEAWANANDVLNNDNLYNDLYDDLYNDEDADADEVVLQNEYYESNDETIEDEWSNANQILNNYYESEQQAEDEYSNLYDDDYDVAVEEDKEEDWSNANDVLNNYDILEDEYANLYDDEDSIYEDEDSIYEDEDSTYDDDSDNYGFDYNDNAVVVEDDNYGYDEYNADSIGYDDDNDDDYEDIYEENSGMNEYQNGGFNAESEYEDNRYDDIYNVIYDDEESYDRDGDPRMVHDLQNNAWVWQLLILSFSLGVCSCLCYYATKIKPSNGSYDFYHYRRKGEYSKVSFESGISAYDHDEIIEHPSQSDIEQSN